jgi:DNA-binding beta-propeller fold protein YncE
MRRRWFTITPIVVALWMATSDPQRGPSIEQTFVAEAQAAAAADAMCLMPDRGDSTEPRVASPESRVPSPESRSDYQTPIAIPTATDLSGDMPPLRLVVDPYPSFNGVAVDTTNDLVLMSDTNRKSLLLYGRTSGSASKAATPSLGQIMGPETGIGFIAGVAMDPEHRELFTVNNDVEDRLVVFGYDARGNVKPKRLLYVPHQSWGVSFNRRRGEIALSVQTPNMFVVFKRDAQKFDAPVRSVRGPKTAMADPHGIYVDDTHGEVFVANHGNFRPGELITSYTAYDARESRQERTGNQFSETARGKFVPSSVTVYDVDATGDVAPLRTITGALSQIDWPMGVAVDETHDELFVANNGDNSILVFARTASGNVAPKRVIRGALTGIKGPMGVAVATDEIWVANFGDHTALVFPRLAAGNAPPRRIVRNAPAGKATSGFGNPYAVTYDSKRQEILVPN